jgi:hypothetical protein
VALSSYQLGGFTVKYINYEIVVKYEIHVLSYHIHGFNKLARKYLGKICTCTGQVQTVFFPCHHSLNNSIDEDPRW